MRTLCAKCGTQQDAAKAGFKYIKTYETTPGPLNFLQPVNRWLLELDELGPIRIGAARESVLVSDASAQLGAIEETGIVGPHIAERNNVHERYEWFTSRLEETALSR